MFFSKKSQISYVSVLALTVVIVSASIFIYFWGKPYMEKMKTSKEVEYLEGKFKDMAKAIHETIMTGSACINIQTDAKLKIYNGTVSATYDSPVRIYNPMVEVPLTVSLFKSGKKFFLNSSGESYKDEESSIEMFHNGTYVCFKDDVTNKVKCVSSGEIVTSNAVYEIYQNGTSFEIRKKHFINEGVSCLSSVSSVNSGNRQTINFKLKCYEGRMGDKIFKINIIPHGNVVYSKGQKLCFELKDIRKEKINSTVSDYIIIYDIYAYFK